MFPMQNKVISSYARIPVQLYHVLDLIHSWTTQATDQCNGFISKRVIYTSRF